MSLVGQTKSSQQIIKNVNIVYFGHARDIKRITVYKISTFNSKFYRIRVVIFLIRKNSNILIRIV